MREEKCEAGCKAYYGGEIKHHPDCFFYPESFTKLYDDLKVEKKIIEQENISMRECIGSVLIRLADYDGYEDVKGLKFLIDGVSETLSSGHPERIMNWQDKEVCPLCLKELKKNTLNGEKENE